MVTGSPKDSSSFIGSPRTRACAELCFNVSTAIMDHIQGLSLCFFIVEPHAIEYMPLSVAPGLIGTSYVLGLNPGSDLPRNCGPLIRSRFCTSLMQEGF